MPHIVTRYSTVSASAPTAGQLETGEVAVNLTDRILYTKNGSGTVVTLGRPINIQEGASTFTWTKPVNASFVLVELLGAGGGGAGGASPAPGAGGGGGSYVFETFKASDLASSCTATVGAGGTGGSAGAVGTAGGDSYFTSSGNVILRA